MPDDYHDGMSYPELQRLAEQRHEELLRAYNGDGRERTTKAAADTSPDATKLPALERKLGPDKVKAIKLITTCVAEGFNEVVPPLIAELKKTRQRVAELEGRLASVPKYVGPWRSDKSYSKGEIVTFDGGMWHCDQDNANRPGTSASGWTLAVKSGRK